LVIADRQTCVNVNAEPLAMGNNLLILCAVK